jgi:hypothetical protein
MNDLITVQGTIDTVSWTAPSGMTWDEWCLVGSKFQKVAGSIRWWLGDWLNEGEKRYSDTYTQAVEATGHGVQYLKDCKWVAKAVPKSVRQDTLTWTHHSHVAKLDTEAQAALLQFAATHELSSRELFEEVRQYQALLADSGKVEELEEELSDDSVLYVDNREFTIRCNMEASDIAKQLLQLPDKLLREVITALNLGQIAY